MICNGDNCAIRKRCIKWRPEPIQREMRNKGDDIKSSKKMKCFTKEKP